MNLDLSDIKQLNEFEGFLSIKPTWTFDQFINRKEKTIALFTGNQWGKNVNVVKQYILRWLGMHPIEEKNMRPWKTIRTYRFCSETLPSDPEGGDRNTIYPIVKRLLPAFLIVDDITVRKPRMIIKDIQGGADIIIEFVSYGQVTQTQAGVQRESIWIDENCSRQFYEEQIPRLWASDGDMIITMTPALGEVTWQFEDIYEKAGTIIRSTRVCKRYKERYNEIYPCTQTTEGDTDICVLMAATDDNPHYEDLVQRKNDREGTELTVNDYLESKLELYDDDTEDIRRYGIFRQISGRVYKDYDSRIHKIDSEKYFPDDISSEWLHGRGIDYHQSTPWYTTFIAISPQDEAFVYDEVVMSPDKFITMQIAKEIARHSKDYKYYYSKIDPLAEQTQTNTGMTTIQDLNRLFSEFRRDLDCSGGYWTSWDTKSTRGREEVKRRLHNSRLCGVPFNNKQLIGGKFVYLPTLWILDNCIVTLDCFKNWRYEEWIDRSKLDTKEAKETPTQKYSHIMMSIECLFKETGFKGRSYNSQYVAPRKTGSNYGRK